MSFSDAYIEKLALATCVPPERIRALETELLAELHHVLTSAAQIEPAGRLTKKILSVVLKQRGCQFI